MFNDRGHPLFYQRLHHDRTQHAEHVLPLVSELLIQAGIERKELSAVAFGQGPGGFTGLRVACGIAQGIAFALEIPVVPVSSLLAVAHMHRAEPFDVHVVIIDARMHELYVGAYAYHQRWQVCHQPMLIQARHLPLWLQQQQSIWGKQKRIQVLGNGLQVCNDLGVCIEPFIAGPQSSPHVKQVAQLGELGLQQNLAISPEQAAPLYIRDKIAFTIQEREQGHGGNPSANWQPS